MTAFCHDYRMEMKEQSVEEINVIKQLMVIMGQQGMREQSQDVLEVLNFVEGMQIQFSVMMDELQGEGSS